MCCVNMYTIMLLSSSCELTCCCCCQCHCEQLASRDRSSSLLISVMCSAVQWCRVITEFISVSQSRYLIYHSTVCLQSEQQFDSFSLYCLDILPIFQESQPESHRQDGNILLWWIRYLLPGDEITVGQHLRRHFQHSLPVPGGTKIFLVPK